MKVKATMTFAGHASENDETNYVQKGTVLDVSANRAYELKRAGLVKDVDDLKTKDAPAAPSPAAPVGADKDKK